MVSKDPFQTPATLKDLALACSQRRAFMTEEHALLPLQSHATDKTVGQPHNVFRWRRSRHLRRGDRYGRIEAKLQLGLVLRRLRQDWEVAWRGPVTQQGKLRGGSQTSCIRQSTDRGSVSQRTLDRFGIRRKPSEEQADQQQQAKDYPAAWRPQFAPA